MADELIPISPDAPHDAELLSGEEAVLEAGVIGTVDPSIVEELRKLRNPKSSSVKTIMVLAISVALFFSLGLLDNPAWDILLLIGVLFFHESGHYLGMRWFGYRDVRMFFIPMFGAAVAGRNEGVESYKQAIVVLLGPIPGLLLSLPMYLLFLWTGVGLFNRLSLLLALINGFNLLPIFPLDGGRLLHITLFSRNRYVECVVSVLAALALILTGVFLGGWILAGFGGLMLFLAPHGLKISSIAHELRQELPAANWQTSDEIPHPVLETIVPRVQERFPTFTQAKHLAGATNQVWERMIAIPPGNLATVLLILTYLVFLLGMLIVPVLVMIATVLLETP